MKALVTGGAGFIGSSLCEALLSEGYEVVAFDDLSTGSPANVAALKGRAGFRFVKGDCRKMEEVRSVGRDADVVFHLAARADVRPDMVSPHEMFEENVICSGDLAQFEDGSSTVICGDIDTCRCVDRTGLRDPHYVAA